MNKIKDTGENLIGTKKELIKYLSDEIINQFIECKKNNYNELENTLNNAKITYETLYEDEIMLSSKDTDILQINYDNSFGLLFVSKYNKGDE